MKRPFLGWMVLLCMFITACAKEPSPTAQIRIAPTIQTRATALNFEANDCIGLRIERATECYAANAPLTYDGNYFTAASLVWYANSDEAATLRAYYPYTAQGFPTEWTVADDQRTMLEESDLLAAVKEGVKPTAQGVQMTFRHWMARLQITVLHDATQEVESVTLGGLVPTAALDWEQQVATPKSGVAPVQVVAAAEGAGYQAILVPQSATIEVVVKTRAGASYTKEVEATLLGGKSYKLSVKIEDEALHLLLSGEIDDWEEGGDIGGDPTPPEDEEGEEDDGEGNEDPAPNPPGDDEVISWKGIDYPTRTIGGKVWMARNLAYLPDEVEIGNGVWYPHSSPLQETDVTALGYLYNYDFATTRQICPDGWHLPTEEELGILIEAGALSDFYTPAGYLKVDNLDGNELTYNDHSNYLLSSTTDADKCVVLRFTENKAEEIKSLFKNYGYSVRCVKD